MVREANKIKVSHDEIIPDVQVVSLGKQISLGAKNEMLPVIASPTPSKRKSKKSPLSNWADDIAVHGKIAYDLDRNVHKHAIAINQKSEKRQIDVKKRAKKSRTKKPESTDKIQSIKSRIDVLEKQTELSDESNLELSDLSDDGLMESVRDC